METFGQLQARMHTLAVEKGTVARKIADGTYTTHSTGTPDELAYITSKDACTCKSFHYRGYCSHTAYVAALETPAQAPCRRCHGRGQYLALAKQRGQFQWVPCTLCDGSGAAVA